MSMMALRWIRRTLAFLSLAPVLLGFMLFHGPPAPADRGIGGRRDLATTTATSPGAIDSAVARALRKAPFRPDGSPSPIAYDPARVDHPVDAYAPPKPGLVLTGVLEGPLPAAVLNGVPGHEGSVLFAVGESLAGLKLRSIKGGTVTITGMDTTWVLTVRGRP